MLRLVSLFAIVAACQGSRREPATTGGSGSGGRANASAATSKRPPNPRRATPPPTLASSALAVGTAAPAIALADTTGAPWTLAGAQAKYARVMLVFYRGDW